MTLGNDPKWVTEAIDALADKLQDMSSPDYEQPDGSREWDDKDVARWKAGEAIRAILPIIQGGK